MWSGVGCKENTFFTLLYFIFSRVSPSVSSVSSQGWQRANTHTHTHTYTHDAKTSLPNLNVQQYINKTVGGGMGIEVAVELFTLAERRN